MRDNQAWLDRWTPVHLMAGVTARGMAVPFWWTFGGALVFEVFEQFLQRQRVGQRYFQISGPESFGNVVCDMVAVSVGYWLGGKLLRRTWLRR